MAITITITVSDNTDATRVATAFNAAFAVPATQAGVKTALAKFIKDTVVMYEKNLQIKNISITDVVTT